MDIRSLKLFIHLASTLHFGKTSQAMHVSAPTLTRAIQRLEDEVGDALFSRDKRRVKLTPSGQQFLLFAQGVLNDWRDLENRLQSKSDQLIGQIHIYCSVTASYSYLFDLLMPFRQAYPDIDIKLSTGDAADAIEWVYEGRADLAIAIELDRMPHRLMFQELGSPKLHLIAPTVPCALSAQLQASPIEWSSLPYITSERGVSRVRLENWCRSLGFKPHVQAEVSGHEAIVSMVALGLGVGVVPEPVLRSSPFADRITPLPVPKPLGAFKVGLCTTQMALDDPRVCAFWEQAHRHTRS